MNESIHLEVTTPGIITVIIPRVSNGWNAGVHFVFTDISVNQSYTALNEVRVVQFENIALHRSLLNNFTSMIYDDFFMVLVIVLKLDQMMKYQAQSSDVRIVCKKEVNSNGTTCNLFKKDFT